MTDYIAAIDNPQNPYHREARKLAETFKTAEFAIADGRIPVWVLPGENRVVPDDIAKLAHYLGYPVDLKATEAARDAQTTAFLAEYRRAQAARTPEQIAEERFEARAAFGPGVNVVNVFTGEGYRT